MTTFSLKKNIHQVVDSIDDKDFLQAVLTIVSDKRKELDYQLTPDQISILDEREKNHLSGKSKSYKLNELKRALAVAK